MDSMGAAISEGDWSFLSGILYTTEEADHFMAQLLSNYPFPEELDGSSNLGISSAFWPTAHHSNCSSQESYYLQIDSNPNFVANNNSPMSMEFSTSSHLVEADDNCLNQEMGNGNVEQAGKSNQEPALPNKNLEPKMEPEEEKSNNCISENSKKRFRSSGDVQKNRRNIARSKKNQIANNEEDGNIAGLNGQTWTSCSSEDDSNASQEFNGKTRANRGAATDPQSLYARKRRERINERLRILQKLVPNGTKVDISTMLEEAVEYVKFLQVQIKLLSSDDLWMYAPIAYNGMDIGLDFKFATPKRS